MSWPWGNPESDKLIKEQCQALISLGMESKEALKTAKQIVHQAEEMCKKMGFLAKNLTHPSYLKKLIETLKFGGI
ncbi:hypothetical protein DXT63_17045 [Thermoanaerobacteraceae bacterium SP2]|nr:hypothetical protein DXT63_17045 [Thermoanaerobacteraceae bacterium SP2]